jgi:hypothetical protein
MVSRAEVGVGDSAWFTLVDSDGANRPAAVDICVEHIGS